MSLLKQNKNFFKASLSRGNKIKYFFFADCVVYCQPSQHFPILVRPMFVTNKIEKNKKKKRKRASERNLERKKISYKFSHFDHSFASIPYNHFKSTASS